MADKKGSGDRARKRIEKAQRQREALRLFNEGLQQFEIAAELGVSGATISRDLGFIREQTLEATKQERLEWLARELSKLDMDEADLRYELRGRDNPDMRPKLRERLQIRDRILRIQERRAKLLGLDSPSQLRNLNVDLAALSDEQLRRIARGEDVLSVLTDSGASAGAA